MLAGLDSRRRLVWAGVVAVALILFGFAPPAAAQSDEQAIGEDGPLVIVGVGGLKWPNISAETTPNIWALLEDPTTSASAVTVHTVGRPVCPTGGWLALSSGRPTPSPRLGSLCIEPYRTRPAGEGGHVVDWQQTKENLAQTSFEPRLGTLDAMLTEGDISTGAIGPGAALALADSNGWVAKYSRLMTKGSFDQDLTIVDAGTVFAEDLSGRSLRNVDAQIQRVIDAAPDNATILITSVSAPEGARVELGVALLRDPAAGTGHYLTSTATRWDGVTRLLDLPPTIAEVFDQPRPSDFGGAPLRLGSERPGAAETVDFLADISVKDLTLRGMSGRVSGLLEVVTFLVIVFLIWRPWDARHDSPRRAARALATSGRARVRAWYQKLRTATLWVIRKLRLRTVVGWARSQPRLLPLARTAGIGVALFFAVFPLSLYLMGAVPWWNLPDSTTGAWAVLIGWSLVLGGAVAVIPWRSPWQAIGIISLVSAVVMGLDAVVGSPLHRGSPMGPSPILGGRFYGFGNTTYSLFVVHTLIFAAVAAAPAARLGRKFVSYLIVGVVGIVALIVDVAPTWGADIGGGLALIPAFAFLAMVLNRARFTLLRVLVIGFGTVAAILGIAFADWLRPPASRSHAGQFFEQLITGDAWQIIWRKAQYALGTLNTGLASRLTLVLVVLAILALIKPERFAPAPLQDAMAEYPALRVTLGAVLVGLVAGAALNDYGLRIVSLGFAAGAPLLALLTVRGALPRARAGSARATSD